MRSPDVPTTPAQWKVIVWTIVIACAVGGVFALGSAAATPEEEAEEAKRLYGIGITCLEAGVVITATYIGVCRWLDEG